MKLPKLPVEFIRRVLTDEEIRSFCKKLSEPTTYGAILVMTSSYIISSYTIEELDKLGVLNDVIIANIYLYDRYELTKEALELFDEIKSNYKALDYFMWGMPELGQNLLKDQNFTKHILDTLIGPEWKEPDFYLYRDSGLQLFFDKNLMCKKDISNILCNGLCIFDDIPKDRLNKFYDALRRLKPYIKRRGFRYTIGNKVRISYKSKDFPISVPERIKRPIRMYLEWHIENNQLIIEKTFGVYDYYKYIQRNALVNFLKRLKEKYPKQMQEVSITTRIYPLFWEHSRKYNLPDDLRGLTDI